MSDLVTIVVPIYNVEHFLDKCVSSIVKQTYKNLEIILVDDGSPDNCPAICDEWSQKDARIRVIHKANQGLGMARNTGIEHAKGKYILFFDSDDYINTSLVEKCMSANANNNADVIWYSMSDVTENGEVLSSAKSDNIFIYEGNDCVIEHLLPDLISFDYRQGTPNNFAFSAWSGMFSMEIINKHDLRFPSERQIISEDTYFLLQYFRYVNKAVTIDDILYFHYVNTSSLTNTYRADRQKKNDYFFSESVSLVERFQYPDEIKIRLCMIYHSFTLASLKMIFCASDVKIDEKRKLCKEILKSKTLQDSISAEVVKREKNTVRLFFKLASLRLFGLCNLLLTIKT